MAAPSGSPMGFSNLPPSGHLACLLLAYVARMLLRSTRNRGNSRNDGGNRGNMDNRDNTADQDKVYIYTHIYIYSVNRLALEGFFLSLHSNSIGFQDCLS